MKKIFLSVIGVLCIAGSAMAQNQNVKMEKQVKEVLVQIEKAAAERNIAALQDLLHKDYRIVANRFSGTGGTTIINKDTYLAMMKDGKVGGTVYSVEFKEVFIFQHTAMAELVWHSEKTEDMHKYVLLVQDDADHWKLISDMPIMVP